MKTNFARQPFSARRLVLPGWWILLAGLLWGAAIPARAAGNDADRILGTWLTENGASKIQITATNDIYSGTLIWLAPRPNLGEAGTTVKAKTPLLGTMILSGFKYGNAAEWVGGKIYAPERGVHYDARLQLKTPNQLEVRISAGLAHKTVVWTRAK